MRSLLFGEQERRDINDLVMCRDFSTAIFEEDVFFCVLDIKVVLAGVFGWRGYAMGVFEIVDCGVTTTARTCDGSVPGVSNVLEGVLPRFGRGKGIVTDGA